MAFEGVYSIIPTAFTDAGELDPDSQRTVVDLFIAKGANGLVGQGGVNCPFSFTNSRATMGADGQITVNYTGTVCGIPVSGTETVKK